MGLVHESLDAEPQNGFAIANHGPLGLAEPVAQVGSHERAASRGEQMVVPETVVSTVLRDEPLLRGLLVTGAGYAPRASGQAWRGSAGASEVTFLYCVKGGGWYDVGGPPQPVRTGDLLVLLPQAVRACGGHATHPWTLHWVRVVGALLPEYMRQRGVGPARPVIHLGEDLHLVALFNEILKGFEGGFSFPVLLHVSQTLAHALGLMVRHSRERGGEEADTTERVARAIMQMSEHLGEPLRVTELAALANLSPAHFTVRFKEQTGCAPRDYLHLLRIHRACQLLGDTSSSVKAIAAMLGYQDQFHFSRVFKAFQGLSPSEYRRQRQAGYFTPS